MMLKPGGSSGAEGDEALECYAKHTAQIEVKARNTLPSLTKKNIYTSIYKSKST